MTVQYIISQVFTIISYILLAKTYHVKNRKTILILNILIQMLFAVAYICLGAWTGLAMALVAIVRNVIFIIDENKKGKKEKGKMNKIDVIVLVVVYIISIISAILTYDSFFSLLPVIATMIYTYAVCQKNIKIYKLLGIPIEILWIGYNIYIKSIFGIILEIIMLINCFTAYFIGTKKGKN